MENAPAFPSPSPSPRGLHESSLAKVSKDEPASTRPPARRPEPGEVADEERYGHLRPGSQGTSLQPGESPRFPARPSSSLNLISSEMLNALAFEHLAAMAQGNGTVLAGHDVAQPPMTHPDVAKHQPATSATNSASWPFRPRYPTSSARSTFEKAAIESRATDIHFDPQGDGLRISATASTVNFKMS